MIVKLMEIYMLNSYNITVNTDFTWHEIGYRIRAWRCAAGMTQQALAKAAKMSQPGLARIENGTVNPQLDTLQKIATVLGRSLRELFCGRQETRTAAIGGLLQRARLIAESQDAIALSTFTSGLIAAEALLSRKRCVVKRNMEVPELLFSPEAPIVRTVAGSERKGSSAPHARAAFRQSQSRRTIAARTSKPRSRQPRRDGP